MDKKQRHKIMQKILSEEAQKELNKDSFQNFWHRTDNSDEAFDQDKTRKERNPSEFKAQIMRSNPYGMFIEDKYQLPKNYTPVHEKEQSDVTEEDKKRQYEDWKKQNKK